MSEILNNIVSFLPVYRVLNREQNLDFFRDVLGMKVLLEEGAMVWLGGHKAQENRFLLEESPESRAVVGTKKHAQTVFTAPAKEVEQLLAKNLDKVSRVFSDGENFAFEAISPENDVFCLFAENLSTGLKEIEKTAVNLPVEADFVGLSDFHLARLQVNVAELGLLDFFGKVFDVAPNATEQTLDLPFVSLQEQVASGQDLLADSEETLDLEFVLVRVKADFDLKAYAEQFADLSGIYLDKEAQTLALTAPNHTEVWFVKELSK